MKKTAYPWIYGHDQSPDGSDTSITVDSPNWYDTLNPSGGRPDNDNQNITEAISGYESGIISPIEDGLEDLLKSLGSTKCSANILIINDDKLSNKLARLKYNVTSISRNKFESTIASSTCEDVRFYNFGKKFDAVFVSKEQLSCKLSRKNINKHLKFNSATILFDNNIIVKMGADSKRVVHIEKRNGESIYFACNIAESSLDREVGLQCYSGLEENEGLLFRNGSPMDVTFHMGTVGFPIDIIFANENGIIKKISKNIQPGDPGLFSCANSLSVLEINGGHSDLLGLDVGDSLRELTLSEARSDSVSRYLNKSIPIKKTSSTSDRLSRYRQYFSKNQERHKGVSIFCIDGDIFSKNSKVKLFPSRPVGPVDTKIARDLNNDTFIKTSDGFYVGLDKIFNTGILKNGSNRMALGANGSFNRLRLDDKFLQKMHEDLCDNKMVVIATSKDLDEDLYKYIIYSKIASRFLIDNPSGKIDIMYMPKDFSDIEKIDAARMKYSCNNIKIFSGNMVKVAGVPVPEEVKKSAKHARRSLERAEKGIAKVLAKFNHNAAEYERVANIEGVVKKSKGLYNNSCKKISHDIKNILIDLKNGIVTLRDIKDISSTEEIIDSITNSAKTYADCSNKIFNLIKIIDADDFVTKHSQEVSRADAFGQDLKKTLERARNYIDSNILGITILSE